MGLFPSTTERFAVTMTRGPKKHLKRLAAPKTWMLDKLGGVFTTRSSSGPHKLRESMPITLFLRNRLKYALTAKEVSLIMKQRLVKIDGKCRTDTRYPTGFMDVVQIEKTNENFRLIYDVKGRFTVHRITNQEAKYKLCRVKAVKTGPKNVPYLYTSDGRTIRAPQDEGVHAHQPSQGRRSQAVDRRGEGQEALDQVKLRMRVAVSPLLE